MNSVLFSITMGTGLALAIDKSSPHEGSSLILSDVEAFDPDQLWTWVFNPGSRGSILYNPGRNVLAAPAKVEKGAFVVLQAMSGVYDAVHTWVPVGDVDGAIQVRADDGLNLNAFGNDWSIGTRVGIWSWGGGDRNEVWTSKLINVT